MKYIIALFIYFLYTVLLSAQPAYQWAQKQTGSSLGGPIDVEMYNTSNVYYGTDNKIYKSTDRGETFTQMGIIVPQATEIKCVIVDDFNPSTIVLGIEGTTDKVVKTTNSGTSWTITADGLSFSYFGIPIAQDPTHPDTLYMMNGINFSRSTDFGSTWTTISTAVGTNSAPCDIEVFPDTSIILVGDNGTGIFKSTNYGVTWSQTYSTSGEIPTITVDFQNPGIAWATKWSGGGGMLKSTNFGQTWSLVPYFGSINMWGVHIQESDGNIILANSYSTSPGSWRSTNAGVTWMPINIPSQGYQVVSVDSMTQFAAQGDGFYKLESDYFSIIELTSFSALIEGLYNGTVMIPDTVTVELRNGSSPYSVVDQAKIYLNNLGQGTGKFFNAMNSTPYFLVLKHRNALETWSATTQTFTNSRLTYDFTTASNKAFGNNLTQIDTKWCIYSGDVNQDGFVNTQDLNSVYTANVIGETGYTATDITGDMFIEIGDLTKVFINNFLGVERKRPIGFLKGESR